MATSMISQGIEFPNSSVQSSSFPLGMIIIWSGAIVNIPTGWQLCNGTNGTPDLRDRFVVGAGSSYAVGATGGTSTVSISESQMPPHTHETVITSISPAGSHTHSNVTTATNANHTHPVSPNIVFTPGPVASKGTGAFFGTISGSGDGGSHDHPVSTAPAGSHSHALTMSVNPAGSGDPHENRPPYYALAFIMKV
jgi:microcystin-dependent protein